MKNITLKGSWIIKAPIDKVFKIISDFENMPKNFPTVAESLIITKKDGNKLEIDAKVKSFGTVFPVKMKTEIIPGKGYISDNYSPQLGISGHEEFLMEEIEEGTRINYIYKVNIHSIWLRIVAKPLLGWYSMKFWENAFIFKLKKIVENN
ncbi:MAG: SRPBCC family protein [Candidatus Nomurabacteria bacterium]|nr:SRPBCC family protein [Candidatus Nomurabacteria bacterium]